MFCVSYLHRDTSIENKKNLKNLIGQRLNVVRRKRQINLFDMCGVYSAGGLQNDL